MKINELVKAYDPQNQFDVLVNTYSQLEYALNNEYNVDSLKKLNFSSILLSGLGGSAISGDLMINFLKDDLKIPFIVNRNYSLPKNIDENSLIIISSYSGNTEETISVFKQALERRLKAVCLTTGGKIEELAIKNNVPVVKLKKGYQPRYSLGVAFFSLLKLLQEIGIIPSQDEVIKEIIKLWKEKAEKYALEGNEAMKYAEQLTGYIPIIYSAADVTSAAGYRFKCQINENSKAHAFCNVIPEFNHNEIIGWETYNDKELNAKVITILDPDYHPQTKKRFEICTGLIKQKGADVIQLESNQKTFKLRLMDLVFLGDWISYYLALIKEKDPSEIEFINKLKSSLA